MKTSPECLPCFLRQAKYASGLATNDPKLQMAILTAVRGYLAGLDLEESPPVNSIGLYQIISQLSGHPDPFATLKRQSNDLALRLRPQVEAIIRQGEDPLFLAILFAMAGNIIDYGSQQEFDLDQALREARNTNPIINDYQRLRHDLAQAQTVLCLADNCGELVFDGLLIDQLPPTITITLAVKGGPIINDATMIDALACGLDQKCQIIANGTTCPGTPLGRCGQEFEDLFKTADVVISKGQGNFETLSLVQRPIYHLLTVKCPVVGNHAAEVRGYPGQIPTGATLLMRLGAGEAG